MTLEYPTSDVVLGQKVKGQGHGVRKCKNIIEGDQVAGVSLHSIEWPAVVLCLIWTGNMLLPALQKVFLVDYKTKRRAKKWKDSQ